MQRQLESYFDIICLFIVITYWMLLSLRKKQSSCSVLNLTSSKDSIIDESFAESNVSKRFTRKKNTSSEHSRNLKSARPQEQDSSKVDQGGKDKGLKLAGCTVKAEDLFLRIAHTPTKGKHSYAPASSDRTTQSTYLRSKIETEGQLKEELEMKASELMLLQDEVMRLRRECSNREQEYLKINIRKEMDHQASLNAFRLEVTVLKSELQQREAEQHSKALELQQKGNQLKQLKKNQAALQREIKSLKYDKLMLEKALEEIYKKRLPKQLKDLISFRELSLIRQLDDLKVKLEESKSENETKLESQIHIIKLESAEKTAHLKKLEVHDRMLSRRLIELESELKEKTETFSRFIVSMKESNNDLKSQLKKIRKENLKLKNLNLLNHPHLTHFHPHPRKKHHHHSHSSSEESLSFSLSSA